MKIIGSGSHGPEVTDVQHRLVALGSLIDAAELEGEFGPSTESAVRRFQGQRNLRVDGIVGQETWNHLVEAGYAFGDRTLYLRYPYFRGDDVRELQRKLNALGFDAWREDGIFGEHVDRAVREFQRNVGAEVDGIVGPDTYETLGRLRPDTSGPGRAVVREAESLRQVVGFPDAVIAVDDGAGVEVGGSIPDDTSAGAGLTQALAEELSSDGARPRLLGEDPSPSARARAANAMGAAVCISVQAGSTGAASCAYYGTDTTHSPAGQRLAGLILERVCAQSGLESGGTHRLAIAILRETRMPAVVVEVPHPLGAAGVSDRMAAGRIARGIVSGVRAFLSTPPAD